MRTIIVPTDFSVISVNAAHYAVDMARMVGADILLVHVVSIPIAISEISVPPDTFDEMQSDANKEMEKVKKELLQYSEGQVNIFVSVTMGNLLEDIRDLATQVNTFSVIMGMQGAGATERLLFGSNALAAIRNLPFPVIIVPRDVQFRSIDKIGLACDMKDIASTIPVESIEKLLKLFGSKLDILHVNKSDSDMNARIQQELTLLQSMMAKFHSEVHFIINENIEAGISEFIDREKIDLLLVIPKQHGFPVSLFHKSISKEIALHLQIPVMALHE